MIRFDYSYHLGDFTIEANGEFPLTGITALFGDSGCGKSTLLRLITGLEDTASGTLLIDGMVIQNEHRCFPSWERDLGYVPQKSALFPHLTVAQNLQYAEKRQHSKKYNWSKQQLIEHFGIGNLLQRLPEQLSGGQQQRVAIVRALLSHPRCLLLDEPVSALDEKSRFDLLARLQALIDSNPFSIIYVSHDRREVAELADYILIMDNGKIVAQ